MGSGGKLKKRSVDPVKQGSEYGDRLVARDKVPSLGEIRRALPPHVFEPSLATSMYYVARELAMVAALMCGVVWARQTECVRAWWVLDWAVCVAYWWCQGTLAWGMFVLGHDCGHGSFSASKPINWIVGNAIHTMILTPFEPWRVTHRHHHRNTGNIDKDEVFYPIREGCTAVPVVRYGPALLAISWFFYLLIGHGPRNVYHFNPNDEMFRKYGAVASCAASLGIYAAWVFVLITLGGTYGWSALWTYYFVPLIVFGCWLTVVTFLHHNDDDLPWFAGDEWDYVRGNLSSVDRDYGPVMNNLIHDIGTHQIHHLFPAIPHYKLVEATAAFRKAFPHVSKVSDEPILRAFVRRVRHYVRADPMEVDRKVYMYPAGSE